PIWAARSNRRSRCFQIDSPSTPPSAGHLPEAPPLRGKSVRALRGAHHASDDRSTIHRSDGFHLEGPKSLFGHRRWSTASYLATIPLTLNMRNYLCRRV